MARPLKMGLSYFSFDVDIFDDEKVIPISSEFGAKGECVIIRVLCAIYRNGYFAECSESFIYKIAKQANLPHTLVKDVITGLVKWGFFDKSVFDSVGVLTSAGIQKRWLEATRKRVNKSDLKFWLIDKETGINVENREFLAEETTLNRTESTQSKLNNIKLNIKEKDIEKEKINLSEKNPPNSIIPNSYFIYLSQMKSEFDKNVDWQNSFCKNNNVSPEILQLKIKEFLIKLQNENCVGENWDQLFKHFANWYKLGIKNQSKFTDNGNKRRKIDTSIPHSAEHL